MEFCKPEQWEDNSYTLPMGPGMFCYELLFWFISIQNSGKQKSKNTLRVEMSQFCDGMVNAIPWEVLIPSTKCEGLSYPTHLLKNRWSVIRNNFLEYRTKQATLFARRNDFIHCSLQIKQNIYSIGIFCAPVVTQFIVEVERKIEKSPIFESLRFLY